MKLEILKINLLYHIDPSRKGHRLKSGIVLSEVEFVHPVSAGRSVKFLPAV